MAERMLSNICFVGSIHIITNRLCIIQNNRWNCSLSFTKKCSKTYFCWKCLKKINSINDVKLFILIKQEYYMFGG